jgi:arginine:pyruvate transaminase
MGITGSGDDGWGVFYKAREMVKAGENVTELTIGEHDIRTAPAILQAMHSSALGGHTGYAMVPGTDALRETVARRTQERTGVPTGPENVLITPGGQAALFAAHLAVLNPGELALYVDPYYVTYPGTLRAVGARARAVQTRSKEGFQPQKGDLEAAALGARSLLVNSPNNPTGAVYSDKVMQGVAEVCTRHDLWLISDEVYDTQIWDGTHLSPRALPEMADRTLVVGSMSKSHAMTGSRCGWIIGPADVIDRLIDLATVTTYGVPGFVQDASVFALERGAAFEAEIGAPFARRREIAQRLLATQNGVGLIPSQGAMYVMLDVRSTGLSGTAFAQALLDAEKIAVMPGESFGQAASGHVRVALTVDDDRFETAMERLLVFAKSCKAAMS